MTLREKIIREIRDRGGIPFSRYMELCLYDPEQGYYSRNAEQFGKAGDFYTSSDVHAVFGRLMARQFDEIWRIAGSPARIQIVELGPGRGLFAQDVLDWSEKKFPDFFQAVQYHLFESSPQLRERLSQTLSRHFANDDKALLSDQSDFKAVLGEPLTIVFANEFFDALPVEIVSQQGLLRIAEHDGKFSEAWQPPSAEVLEFLDRYGVQPEAGEKIEVPLAAHRFMSQIGGSIRQGAVIAVDYGYSRQEQLAGRHRGTLMTYRQHSAGANPYEAPGEQDITAHVNFTSLRSAAEQNGMTAQPLVTQSQFLLGIGESTQFADVFEGCRVPQEKAKVALQLKHLISPSGMGETFHVLVSSKGIDHARFENLSGLSFGKRA